MASIAEFLEILSVDVEKAFRTYFFNVDSGLDGDYSKLQACRVQTVGFKFEEPNKIVMCDPANSPMAYEDQIWYLPWLHKSASKAVLDGKGPGYFSTSQLDGCRFTIQYHDDSRKKATVFHLAGNVGRDKQGSGLRDDMETASGLDNDAPPRLVRRYSITSGIQSNEEPKGNDFKLKYDGDKAWIFGFRDDDGAWQFYAQQMAEARGRFPDSPPIGKNKKGLRQLSTN